MQAEQTLQAYFLLISNFSQDRAKDLLVSHKYQMSFMCFQPKSLPRFFSPRKVNLKIPINSGLQQAGIARPRKMTLGSWFHQILLLDKGS
jgi:hypothetical protein